MEPEENLLKEVENTDTQEAMDCAFRERLNENINASVNKFLSENIERILRDTYLQLSSEYHELQYIVDQSYLKCSDCSLNVTVG